MNCLHDWRPSPDPTERGIWVCDFCYRATTQPVLADMMEMASRDS